MRLATGCLSIGEDCAIESLEDTVDDWFSRSVVNLFLGRLHIVHVIKAKIIASTLWNLS
jgi:hypothetical protein